VLDIPDWHDYGVQHPPATSVERSKGVAGSRPAARAVDRERRAAIPYEPVRLSALLTSRSTRDEPARDRPQRIRRSTAVATLVLLALTVVGLLGGCTRVRTALAVQGDDTVAGEIVVATSGGPPPTIVVPAPLAGRVTVTPYQAEGYQGSQLRFTGLRFDEVNSLASIAPQAQGRFRFALRRSGNLVVLNGQVDLTALPVDRADVQLKVAFPGEVVNSDGEIDSDAVSWVFSPGQVSEFNAVVSAPDPTAPSVGRWMLLIGAVVAAAVIGVVLLAKANRNPPVRSAGRGP
jgi:hypothetical protein